MPGARGRGRVDLQIAFGERGARVGQAEQSGQLLVGPHRDQVAARSDPVGEHGHLRRGQRHFAEDDDVVVGQHRRRDRGDVDDRERVQPLGAQDFCVVAAERIAVLRDDEDRPSGPSVGGGGGGACRGEGPGVVRGERVARGVLDAARSTLQRGGVAVEKASGGRGVSVAVRRRVE